MIIINKYELEPCNDCVNVKCREAPRCPKCESIMSGYDSRKRTAIGGEGEPIIYKLHCAKCSQCGTVHLLIPDFMKPYKHYTADVINSAVTDASCCPAEDSSIRRWKRTK